MIIKITGSEGSPEFVLLELQGTLAPTTGTSCDGSVLGRVFLEVRSGWVLLCAVARTSTCRCTGLSLTRLVVAFRARATDKSPTPQDNRLVLLAGNQRIVGSVQPLPKALHVLQKRDGAGGAAPEYVVHCVVKRKLVFTARPVPVISAAAGLSVST